MLIRHELESYGFIIFLTDKRRTFNKVVKQLGLEKVELTSIRGMCYPDNKGTFIIGVFDNSIDSLTHELGHMMIQLFGHINTEINDATSEPFCYMLGYLTQKFGKELKLIKE